MRKLFRPLLSMALLLSTISAPAFAQDLQPRPVDADPALWVLRDDDTTIYLFGTVHILKPGIIWFDEAVKQAFDKSDTLVTEIIEPESDAAIEIIKKYAIDKSGKNLRSKLTVQQKKDYAQALTKLGIALNELDPLEPWLAAMTIEMSYLKSRGYDSENGVENILMAEAIESNKKILELESFEKQVKLMSMLPKATQIEMLLHSAKSVNEPGDEMAKLFHQWANADLDGLAKSMNDGLKDPILRNAMLTKRNANWAAWISQRMAKPGTIFVAVGAGHLSGADSVQQQLKAYKFEAKRIEY